ncbi:uncharacterized protein LOC105420579 [Amborella trichopoda]|uniref:uncharacterized protein LOC105420579 n=1 Tax=Amborella trichopoda TaxID=13333 RepID=UPI0005D40A78|nr:uncharacterized protein LOC105420579 [Amborella trichopoda]|eukprot:XP_011622988.1 uncharacterized protein LOC105420579 [Amborella trichopoda]
MGSRQLVEASYGSGTGSGVPEKLLDEVYISLNVVDEVVWEIDKDGEFLVKSTYQLLFHDRWRWSRPRLAVIWRWPLPLKVQGFIWLVVQNKVLKVDDLIKRGKILSNICPMCKENWESGDHLFLHCSFTFCIWRRFFALLGFAMVMPPNVEGVLHNLTIDLPQIGAII